jgi:SAM-dependent methyltransferase
VTVAQALHWFDLDPFIREARRVLVPAGVLAVWCYSKCTVNAPVDEIVDLFYTVTLGAFWPKERRHVDEGYRTIALPLDEMAAPPFEMVEQWSLSEFAAYIRTWSAVNKFIETRGEAPLFAFEEALAEMWGDPVQRKRVKWPIHFRIGEIR